MTASNVTSSKACSHDEKEWLIPQEQSEEAKTKDNSSPNQTSLIKSGSCPGTYFLRQGK